MKRFFKFTLKSILWFIIISLTWVLFYKWVPVPYTPLMAIRYFSSEENYEHKHDWVSIEEISPYLQLAVICAEDQNFTKHRGFDVKSIEKAYENNKKGKKTKGGSSISQQVAKNVFLWPDRNWLRKGLETWFTFLIETFWSKERIMEVYLNSIEMGNGVFGAEAASQYWFHKSAKNISRDNAAALAAILPSPRKYRAQPRTNYIENRKNWIVRQMQNYGTFTLDEKRSE
ncbi:monofunctional biosynthetic peptidoglycan transglycosylase [Ulvibacter sp. MAR_2010_11]|uniref:monofunctional biosynthetic peptidoglycan transglycosylase n=1 Tax=Ulvibacter sp. MAR_2010_11 TaxID=1250229 RepID=UPI000C2CD885|nr:monofunctional biosynthetic peptidoglycan transglycosylase [Ulvibacter sp. MAR_2010_11]PKA82976.1 monofunctional biosynthetic peptidoglycan transglycosylase [Ulvibacter sp. MAR_2010_11]